MEPITAERELRDYFYNLKGYLMGSAKDKDVYLFLLRELEPIYQMAVTATELLKAAPRKDT